MAVSHQVLGMKTEPESLVGVAGALYHWAVSLAHCLHFLTTVSLYLSSQQYSRIDTILTISKKSNRVACIGKFNSSWITKKGISLGVERGWPARSGGSTACNPSPWETGRIVSLRWNWARQRGLISEKPTQHTKWENKTGDSSRVGDIYSLAVSPQNLQAWDIVLSQTWSAFLFLCKTLAES